MNADTAQPRIQLPHDWQVWAQTIKNIQVVQPGTETHLTFNSRDKNTISLPGELLNADGGQHAVNLYTLHLS